jgi:hypothetical protein
MPCYSAWNDHLRPGTPEYLCAEAEVKAKLESIKHIVNYYYQANSYGMPAIADGVAIDAFRQPRSEKERAIRETICHHFACDAVDVSTLYDACSLLDANRPEERSYLAVILPCATLIRQNPEKFKASYN